MKAGEVKERMNGINKGKVVESEGKVWSDGTVV